MPKVINQKEEIVRCKCGSDDFTITPRAVAVCTGCQTPHDLRLLQGHAPKERGETTLFGHRHSGGLF